MTIPVKGKEAVTIESHVPWIITSNKLPDFGTDAANVARRLYIFNVKPLPTHLQVEGVVDIFRENCMNYLHYIAQEISRNRDLVEPRELFYEQIPHIQLSAVEIKRKEVTNVLRTGAKKMKLSQFRSSFPNDADMIHHVRSILKFSHSLIFN